MGNFIIKVRFWIYEKKKSSGKIFYKLSFCDFLTKKCRSVYGAPPRLPSEQAEAFRRNERIAKCGTAVAR